MDKLTQLIKEYNYLAKTKEELKHSIEISNTMNGQRKEIIKSCDRQMDKLKKEISELSKE